MDHPDQTEAQTPCPVCGCNALEYRTSFFHGPESVAVFFCKDCESLASPFATPEPVSTSVKWHLSVREWNVGFSNEMFDSIGIESPVVLDVGCGIGTVIETATKRGGGGVGFELNPACSAFGTAIGLDIRASLWDLDTVIPRPNLITCIMVLEHLHQPRALLHDLVLATRKYDAPLFISVPWFERRWWHYLDEPVISGSFHPFEKPRSHVSHFSKAGFEAVVRSFGITETRFINGGWAGFLMR